MHLDPATLRAIAFGVVLLIVFGSRFTTGSSRQTAEGLVFGIKPLIAWTRIIILPALIALVIYFWIVGKQPIAWWVPVL